MLWIALAVVLLPLGLLAVPLRLTMTGQPEGQPVVDMEVRWLFGLVRIRPGNSGHDGSGRSTGRPERARKEKKPRRRGGSGAAAVRRGLAFVRGSGGIGRMLYWLRRLLASSHPRVLGLSIEVGLGDPADTGQAWAVLGPLAAWLSFRFGGETTLRPNFLERRFSVEGTARFTLVPLQTLLILLCYLASPRTVRGFMAAWEVSP